MAKKIPHKCTVCGQINMGWLAECPNCGAIGTLDETTAATLTIDSVKTGSRADKASTGDRVEKVADIKASSYARLPTGVSEFDRVLGGGLVPAGIVLLAGAPGAGKSSLTNLAASKLSENGHKVLIVSGEETKDQIKSRLDRIKAHTENLYLLSENNLSNVKEQILNTRPEVLIIDSVQTLVSPNSEGRVGSITQVTEVAHEMTQIGKQLGIPVILIGHVTKDGNIAGPRVVEHLVDAVLLFEGSKDSPLKLLRGVKNRYGATDEIGCFEHASDGLHEIVDPSGFLLHEHAPGVAGYATSIIVEGNRALPIEVQALTTPSPLPNPRKVNHGLDNSRVLMVQAIVEKYSRYRLSDKDVYVSTTGGLVSKDTSIDLAVAAAIISSLMNVSVPDKCVVLGETTLTGEVRQPRDAQKRISEAKRLGFDTIITPLSNTYVGDKKGLIIVNTIDDLVQTINNKGTKS